MRKIVSFLFLLVISSTSLKAQYGSTERPCRLCAVDFGAGWYMPSLGYLNDESYLSDIGGSFDGGLMFVGAAEVKVYGSFFAGVQLGYWSDKVTVTEAGAFIAQWNEELSITIIPVTLFGKYEFNLSGTDKLFPFLGAGFTTNLVSQELNREVSGVPTNESLSGSSSTIQLLAGAKYSIAPHIDAGLEYNYVLGGFDQTFIEEGVESVQNVGLDGSLFLAKISFTIDDRANPRSGSFKRKRGKSSYGKRGGSSRKFKAGKSRYKPGKRRKSSSSRKFKRPKRRGRR